MTGPIEMRECSTEFAGHRCAVSRRFRGAALRSFVEKGDEARANVEQPMSRSWGWAESPKSTDRAATDLGPAHPMEPFSLVFLDPPYARKLATRR